MQREDFFDFLASVDIRVRGTRIGIETVLLAYQDENPPPFRRDRLRERGVGILRVGDAGAPPLGASDPDILKWREQPEKSCPSIPSDARNRVQ